MMAASGHWSKSPGAGADRHAELAVVCYCLNSYLFPDCLHQSLIWLKKIGFDTVWRLLGLQPAPLPCERPIMKAAQ
jgi:hypothetical protein